MSNLLQTSTMPVALTLAKYSGPTKIAAAALGGYGLYKMASGRGGLGYLLAGVGLYAANRWAVMGGGQSEPLNTLHVAPSPTVEQG